MTAQTACKAAAKAAPFHLVHYGCETADQQLVPLFKPSPDCLIVNSKTGNVRLEVRVTFIVLTSDFAYMHIYICHVILVIFLFKKLFLLAFCTWLNNA